MKTTKNTAIERYVNFLNAYAGKTINLGLMLSAHQMDNNTNPWILAGIAISTDKRGWYKLQSVNHRADVMKVLKIARELQALKKHQAIKNSHDLFTVVQKVEKPVAKVDNDAPKVDPEKVIKVEPRKESFAKPYEQPQGEKSLKRISLFWGMIKIDL
jgi:hypothetical protein